MKLKPHKMIEVLSYSTINGTRSQGFKVNKEDKILKNEKELEILRKKLTQHHEKDIAFVIKQY